uniref:Retrotransposon gag domain-containing protein n=1 Tax=Spongospora subterranea TaxID=70186 RepID=A0A0H5QYN0_9EUKA|eukprot:CRZ06776.1 hypothetical protein [Spongospora subterranea]
MTGLAADWLVPRLLENSPIFYNLELFLLTIKGSFDDPHRRRTSARAIRARKQTNCATFTEYETQFRLFARDVDWSPCALIDQFREGLYADVDDYLNVLEDCGALHANSSLDEVVTAASRYVARRKERPNRGHWTPGKWGLVC